MVSGLASAPAADARKAARIGVIFTGASSGAFGDGLREGLREAGYTEGNNISIEWRYAADPD